MSARIPIPGRRRLTPWTACALLLGVVGGCDRGDGAADTPAFVPSWTEARQSLDASLSAWRDATASSLTPLQIPGVQFVDKTRKPDQRLVSFQVLGQTDIENARQFTVKLELSGEESPQLVKYNVLGRNPVWVFRLDDYEMFAHWEHEMPDPAAGPGQKPLEAVEPRGDGR